MQRSRLPEVFTAISATSNLYTNAIMGDPAQRAAHIKDATDFFAAVDDGSLPAVSFVKP